MFCQLTMSLHHAHAWCPWRAEKNHRILWNSNYKWLWATLLELGIEPEASGRAADAFSNWAFSLAWQYFFILKGLCEEDLDAQKLASSHSCVHIPSVHWPPNPPTLSALPLSLVCLQLPSDGPMVTPSCLWVTDVCYCTNEPIFSTLASTKLCVSHCEY